MKVHKFAYSAIALLATRVVGVMYPPSGNVTNGLLSCTPERYFLERASTLNTTNTTTIHSSKASTTTKHKYLDTRMTVVVISSRTTAAAGSGVKLCYYPISNKTAASVTGVDLQSDRLAEYYPSNCTSCGESDLPWKQANDDAKDQDKINGLCEKLFYDAGKCNNNYKYHDKGVYGGYKNDKNGNRSSVDEKDYTLHFIFFKKHRTAFISTGSSSSRSNNGSNSTISSTEQKDFDERIEQAIGFPQVR